LANLLYTFYTFYTDFEKGVFCNKEGRFLQQSQVYAGRESQFEAFLATAFTQRGTAEEADAMGGGAERSCGWDEQCAGRTKSNPPRPYAFEQKGYGRARLRWRRRGRR
jgi:hypothetical protein